MVIQWQGTYNADVKSATPNRYGLWDSWEMNGREGNDTLRGGAKSDKLHGHENDDTLYGMEGNDILEGGFGIDKLYGGIGDDTLIIDDSADQAFESAGQGFDTVKTFVDYTLGAWQSIEKLQLEELAVIDAPYTFTGPIKGVGNELANIIVGNRMDNLLEGKDGNDELWGGGSGVTGSGKDTLRGGNGNDEMFGLDGDDEIYGEADTDYIDGGAGFDQILAGAGFDTVYAGSGEDNISGGADNDTIYGEANNDYIHGDDGNDTLDGSDGDDTLLGDMGSDVLYGGNGQDYLRGALNLGSTPGTGEFDKLSGGSASRDAFALASRDNSKSFYVGQGRTDYALITDFSTTDLDVIHLKGSASNYEIRKESFSVGSTTIQEAAIYLKGTNELIGVVQDQANLSLTSSSFTYV